MFGPISFIPPSSLSPLSSSLSPVTDIEGTKRVSTHFPGTRTGSCITVMLFPPQENLPRTQRGLVPYGACTTPTQEPGQDHMLRSHVS